MPVPHRHLCERYIEDNQRHPAAENLQLALQNVGALSHGNQSQAAAPPSGISRQVFHFQTQTIGGKLSRTEAVKI
jgi:hypothetical protein